VPLPSLSTTLRQAADNASDPYQVQVDKNGAIVVWCYDVDGNTVSSHSTSMHRPAVDTVETFIVQKDAGETLLIRLERRAGRVVITDVS
jgi:hypothetical protein